jgi:hypothetical protein
VDHDKLRAEELQFIKNLPQTTAALKEHERLMAAAAEAIRASEELRKGIHQRSDSDDWLADLCQQNKILSARHEKRMAEIHTASMATMRGGSKPPPAGAHVPGVEPPPSPRAVPVTSPPVSAPDPRTVRRSPLGWHAYGRSPCRSSGGAVDLSYCTGRRRADCGVFRWRRSGLRLQHRGPIECREDCGADGRPDPCEDRPVVRCSSSSMDG